MKREELIKLIEDNFKEGEEVSFRYSDDQGDVITQDARVVMDESEQIIDGVWRLTDKDGNLLRECTSEEMTKIERDRRAKGEQPFWAYAEWKTLKSKKVVTKVIAVS